MFTSDVVTMVVAFRRHWAGSVVAVGSGVETVVAAVVGMANGADGRQRGDDALAVVEISGQLVVFAGFVHAGHEALFVAILEHVCFTKFPLKKSTTADSLDALWEKRGVNWEAKTERERAESRASEQELLKCAREQTTS